jgi:hypothetical protein
MVRTILVAMMSALLTWPLNPSTVTDLRRHRDVATHAYIERLSVAPARYRGDELLPSVQSKYLSHRPEASLVTA